jgi:hypothetical protein
MCFCCAQGVLQIIKERMNIDQIQSLDARASIDDEEYNGPLAQWKDLADRFVSPPLSSQNTCAWTELCVGGIVVKLEYMVVQL